MTRWVRSSVALLSTAASYGPVHLLRRGNLRTFRPAVTRTLLTGTSFRCFGRSFSPTVLCAAEDLTSLIQQKNTENSLVVYTRSWCPFCAEVTQLLESYKVRPKIFELDTIVEGDDIQYTLAGMTGSRTVPQVFVGGKFIGGCDDTYSLHQKGELRSLLEGAGVPFEE